MKKLVIGLLFVANIAGAACIGPFCWDESGAYIKATTTIDGVVTNSAGQVNSAPMYLYSRTLAQINQLTPTAVGGMVYCNNCTRSSVCVSSGTATGAWTVVSSTDTFPTVGTIHCQ